MFIQTVTHQAKQTADLIDGAQAAEEAHEHGESPNSNQDVAGRLYSCGVIWMDRSKATDYHNFNNILMCSLS